MTHAALSADRAIGSGIVLGLRIQNPSHWGYGINRSSQLFTPRHSRGFRALPPQRPASHRGGSQAPRSAGDNPPGLARFASLDDAASRHGPPGATKAFARASKAAGPPFSTTKTPTSPLPFWSPITSTHFGDIDVIAIGYDNDSGRHWFRRCGMLARPCREMESTTWLAMA
jgi:hypothetical protein